LWVFAEAVPKRILDVMNVQGLTRENVASHLQKYRLYLKRLSGVNPEPYPVASFQAAENGTSGGVMQIQPGGRAVVSSGSKGWNLGGGVSRNIAQKDAEARGSLQAQLLQQKQQRQQLAGTLEGLNQLTAGVAFPDLQRMDSHDLDLLMKPQYDPTRQRPALANDHLPILGNLNVLENFDLSGLIDLKEGENAVAMSNLGTLSTHNNLNSVAMGTLQRGEDMGSMTNSQPGDSLSGGPGFSRPRGGDDLVPVEGMGLGLSKFGGEFTSASCFSSVDTLSNEDISESSFKDYQEFAGSPDFLTPPNDLSLS
jgi:hypothetical protein